MSKEEQKLEEIKESNQDDTDSNQNVKEQKTKPLAPALLELIENDESITLFYDKSKNPYVHLPIDNHFETWPCRSRQFKRWAAKLFWDKRNRVINSDALNNALNVLEGKACFEGDQINLANRVCWHDEEIWYDLSDNDWRAIRVNKDGWRIIENPPILFKKYSHQQAQTEPTTNGNAEKIFDFININDQQKRLLLLVYIISCFIPDFPHTFLNIYGQAGSAKTSLSVILKKIIDPSLIEEDEFPKSSAEFSQKLSHHWFICFGNVSAIPGWLSNLLCKASTGAGFSKRELYTDDEDVICQFKRCLVINGINLAATKSDLLERCILLELEKIPTDQRMEENDLWKTFDAEKASILGGIFDAISKAMNIKDRIEIKSLPRMADFTLWGCAIAEALGYPKEDFLRAYYDNIILQNQEVIMENIEANLLIGFMESRAEWLGTATQLLTELRAAADKNKIDYQKDHNFPKTAIILSKQLNLLKPNLENAGIKIARSEQNKQRMLYIQKVQENIVSIDESFAEPISESPSAAVLKSPQQQKFGLGDNNKNNRNDKFFRILESVEP